MKICLVTGGARGIGAAVSKQFARNGYTVIINYNHSEQQAQLLQSKLREEGSDVHLYKADVSRVTEVREMLAYVDKYFKHLDVLVNNAGVALSAMCRDVSEEDFDKVFDCNVKAVFFCSREALPLLGKVGGTIVNVSSIWGLEGASCESVYSASKHAIVGLTRSLAAELAPGVKVNCVCPPIVATDMCAHLSASDIDTFCEEHGVRLYTPEQVAQDIFSLATGGETGIILSEK